MQAPLPIASYLFVLRKHLWLVLGAIVLVVGAGVAYLETARPVFRSVARVEIHLRTGTASADRTYMVRDDPGFIADQVHRLRQNPKLAERVLRFLRTGEDAGPEPAAGKDPVPGGEAPGAPRAPGEEDVSLLTPEEKVPEDPIPAWDPALFAPYGARDLQGMVSVAPVPPTSFYEIAVRGEVPAVNCAAANGFARVLTMMFAEARKKEHAVFVREYLARRTRKKGELAAAREAIRAFKTARSEEKVDLETAGAEEKAGADDLRRKLTQEESRHSTLSMELEAVKTVLASAGLAIRGDSREGFRMDLHPGPREGGAPGDGGEGPGDGAEVARRLHDPRVQSLDVVTRNEGARRSRAAVEELEAEDRRLAPRMKEDRDERAVVRAQIASQRDLLARYSEASLLKLAQDEALSRGVVEKWREQVGGLDQKAGASAAARARLESLQAAAASIQADLDGLDRLILEAERQRREAEQGGGKVRVELWAQPGDEEQVAPRRALVLGGAIAAALLLAAGLAYVLEFLDDTVKSREDFDRLVRLPFLGYVPHLKGGEESPRELVVARGRTGSPEVESFRALRTGIQFSRGDREVRTFLVTSSGPEEGKTTVSINLASAFAGGKGRVLLVDADLRRARVHTALGIENRKGLTNVLVGESDLAGAVQRSSVEGLDVLSSGPIPPNPAEVLGSERMADLLREAAGRYDRVVVDSPPIVAVTDPALLAKYVDAVFLVICVGKTSIRTIQRARETMAAVGAGIQGAILNNADVRVSGYAEHYGGYGYGYGYGYANRT